MTGPATPSIIRFAAWPDRYPGVAFLILVLLGASATIFAVRLPVGRAAPTAPAAALQVRAELPGIDAVTIESTVTQPLLEALSALRAVERTVSDTREGRVDLMLRFASTAARDSAIESARDQVRRTMPRLPDGMSAPSVEPRAPPIPPAVVYAVTAENLSPNVVQWAERMLAGPLREAPAVASVAIEGAPEPEILIQPDVRRLVTLGLAFDDLIQALRRQDQAPARKRARRAIVAAGSAEAIAARAVRLPNGEPIALAEVARVSTVEGDIGEAPRYRGAPALMLSVYPRTVADTARVAERAQAHLAWLRANELIPPDMVVHVRHDEARAAKQASKDIARRVGVYLAIALLVTVLLFGSRRGGLLACAFGVWLPVSGALLWMFGFSLNAMTASAWMLAGVPFVLMVTTPWFPGLALFAAGAAAVIGVGGQWLGEDAQISAAFAITLAAGIFVAWLLTPWMHRDKQAKRALVRLLPMTWRARAEPLAVVMLAAAILAAASVQVRALTANASKGDGRFAVRVQGTDAPQLTAVGESLLPPLRESAGVDAVFFSAAPVTTWRLELDESHMYELGISVAEIGRALAIARDGLVVGEIVHGETLYRLRLQLPAGAAGDEYTRLLLRGERKNQPAVYLRDVGIAVQEVQPRELLRVNGEPAVEITARWTTPEARATLERFCRGPAVPSGYERECGFSEGAAYEGS